MKDNIQAINELITLSKKQGLAILDSKNVTFRSMIETCKDFPNFSSLLKKIIINYFLPLNELLFASQVLFKFGESIPPREYLTIFNNSLLDYLQKEGKSEFIFHNNEVLIGEIVSVFTSLTFADNTQSETVNTLLGNFKWYKDYLDPLGLIK